jgi:hypothetical protein
MCSADCTPAAAGGADVPNARRRGMRSTWKKVGTILLIALLAYLILRFVSC